MAKIRKRLYDDEAILLGKEPNTNKKENRNQALYYVTHDEWAFVLSKRNKGITDGAKTLGLNTDSIPHGWLKSKDASFFFRNPDYKTPLERQYNELEESILNTIDKHISGRINPLKRFKIKNPNTFDLAVITDVHIGMNPNPDGFSLYGGKWDKKELLKRAEIFVNYLLNNKKSDFLYIFDLGDLMDGWNGETARGGHKLPQNMTNEEAFDAAFEFKTYILGFLSKHYKQITMINICDDNHSSSFGYITNQSIKKYIESVYDNVFIKNQRKFISHYIISKKCFIATHGKDSKNLKFGFKPILDPKQMEMIENYIDEHNLHNYDIYFIKGDSHQDILDNSTSQKFKYWNFPAFSPSSNWVQTNFKKGISGFYMINFYEKTVSLNPYYFDWIK